MPLRQPTFLRTKVRAPVAVPGETVNTYPASCRQKDRRKALPARFLFTVAQIFKLAYRRFAIGQASVTPKTRDFAGDPQVTNLRYSRLQVCATSVGNAVNRCPARCRQHLDSTDARVRGPVPTAPDRFEPFTISSNSARQATTGRFLTQRCSMSRNSGNGDDNGPVNIQHPTSNIQHRTSNIEHPTLNIQRPTLNIQRPTSNIQRPTSNTLHPSPRELYQPCCTVARRGLGERQVTLEMTSPHATEELVSFSI
jgi:hypothetical protein